MDEEREISGEGLIGGLILVACFFAALVFAVAWHDQTPGAALFDFGNLFTLGLFFLLPGVIGLVGAVMQRWSPYFGGVLQVIVGYPGVVIFFLVSFITLISVPLFLVVPVPALVGFFLLARSGSKVVLNSRPRHVTQ